MLRRLASSAHARALFVRLQLQPTAIAAPRRRPHSTRADLDREIEAIADLATTARDEMDFAEDSRNSVYYNDDKKAAHDAVEEMAAAYAGLLGRLGAADRAAVEQRIGMRIKEIQSAYEVMTMQDLED
ncbi:hypothetical protein H4R18_000589 [Coemansia javaensis]|uniref:Uncharacterized protein n=1 Tax=Coemansia javaensis TaxID=2761396 RepID=A0A9W8HN81_9FUNG|nr:hypothetical protein H4R18_000589 [Coemansia javaensis]